MQDPAHTTPRRPGNEAKGPFRIVTDTVEGLEALDPLGAQVAERFNALVPRAGKAVLNGSWLGHAVHPLLTDLVVGSFTSATLLDLIGGRRSATGANRLVGIGLAAYPPTAITGLSDWADSKDDLAVRRTGLVHAASNALGAGLYAASVKPRGEGSRLRATMLGLGAMAVMGAGAYLGGHLTAIRGIEPRADEATTESDAGASA